MKDYEYILLACGGLEGGDFSMAFDTADQAYDYGEKLEADSYVTSWSVRRIKAGTWSGKEPTDCIRSSANSD